MSGTNEPRARVVEAAQTIIRSEGLEKLTMRHLADVAQVALKTPYNLFGSKTGVLIEILDQTSHSLLLKLDEEVHASKVEALIGVLNKIDEFFGTEEAYFRGIFWEIMTSNHGQARQAAHNRIMAITVFRVAQARLSGELRSDIDPNILGEQLGLNLLANMGSWAGGHLTIHQTIAHTRAVWASLLHFAIADSARPFIDDVLAATRLLPGQPGVKLRP